MRAKQKYDSLFRSNFTLVIEEIGRGGGEMLNESERQKLGR